LLDVGGQDVLIFKHAISTVAMGKTLHSHGEKPAVLAASAGAPASGEAVAMPRPSGTEG
jgi:hypothetical protein